MEHLVEGHLGGYYISDDEPEFIEEYCEECGDSDRILTSWDSDEENARLNGLMRYLMASNLKNREDLYNNSLRISYLNSYYNEDIISLLINEIESNCEEVRTIVSYLRDNDYINEEEYSKIILISNFEEERQIKMIKYFEESMFTIDSKTGKSVLKRVMQKQE